MVTWVSWQQYYEFCRQAAENDGRIIIEAPGFSPAEIVMNAEYARKVSSEIDQINDTLNRIWN